jgi:hypothetical protein
MQVTIQYDHCKNPHRASINKDGYVSRFNIKLPKYVFELLKAGKTVQANRCSLKLYNKKDEEALKRGELEFEKEKAEREHKKSLDEVTKLREELNRMTLLIANAIGKKE